MKVSEVNVFCYHAASKLHIPETDGQHDLPANQALLISVAVRLGALMVLMLTVGRWADVLHILVCFLGEASCLIPATDLLNATSSQVSDPQLKMVPESKDINSLGNMYNCVSRNEHKRFLRISLASRSAL